MPTLSIPDIAELFGTTIDRLGASTLEQIRACDWHYEVLQGNARDAIIVDLLQRVEERKLTTVANEDSSRWVRGWGENLQAFQGSQGDLEALVPKYIRPGQVVRLMGDFVQSRDPNFEFNWFRIFSQWFFATYLHPYSEVFEFGSGSGINVANLAAMFPEKTIHGLDWAPPAVEIIESLRTLKGMNTYGHQFDFFHPDDNLNFPNNSAVLTVGALEQTGTQWHSFIDYLLRKGPSIVHHIEPIYEWYDPSELVDYTACKAHEVRNFWRGFPPYLLDLERNGKVRIHRTKRAFFGSLVLEGYSQISWSPI